MTEPALYRLVAADGTVTTSVTLGTFGGHRRNRIYGRLECKAARRALTFGGSYAQQRVFFADEATARAAGYRPCGTCMPVEYKAWKAGR